jgi:hypothetical protein
MIWWYFEDPWAHSHLLRQGVQGTVRNRQLHNYPTFQYSIVPMVSGSKLPGPLFFSSPQVDKQHDSSDDHKGSKDLPHAKGTQNESQVGIRLSEELYKKAEYPIKKKKDCKKSTRR